MNTFAKKRAVGSTKGHRGALKAPLTPSNGAFCRSGACLQNSGEIMRLLDSAAVRSAAQQWEGLGSLERKQYWWIYVLRG